MKKYFFYVIGLLLFLTSCVVKKTGEGAGNSQNAKPLTVKEQGELNKELMTAVENDDISSVEKLLDKGADANAIRRSKRQGSVRLL